MSGRSAAVTVAVDTGSKRPFPPVRCCSRASWFPCRMGLAALVYCNSRVSLRLRVPEKRRAAGAVLPTEENGGWSGSRG